MGVNKVVVGNEVKVDLTGDTVTPQSLANGITAHNAAGDPIVGTMPTDIVRYGAAQSLTDAQKAQARSNIGAEESLQWFSAAEIGTIFDDIMDE